MSPAVVGEVAEVAGDAEHEPSRVGPEPLRAPQQHEVGVRRHHRDRRCSPWFVTRVVEWGWPGWGLEQRHVGHHLPVRQLLENRRGARSRDRRDDESSRQGPTSSAIDADEPPYALPPPMVYLNGPTPTESVVPAADPYVELALRCTSDFRGVAPGAAAAAARPSCSCSTRRPSCCSVRRTMPGHRGRGDSLGQPAAQAGARHDVGEAELDPSAAAGRRAQAPAPSVIEAGHRCPREVARRIELDHLDQPADFGRAHPEQHPIAGFEAGGTIADHLPAGNSRHVAEDAFGIGHDRPHVLDRRGEHGVGADPHPITGKRRSAASASRASCIRRIRWS